MKSLKYIFLLINICIVNCIHAQVSIDNINYDDRIRIGIIQRFGGSGASRPLEIKASPNDQLLLYYPELKTDPERHNDITVHIHRKSLTYVDALYTVFTKGEQVSAGKYTAYESAESQIINLRKDFPEYTWNIGWRDPWHILTHAPYGKELIKKLNKAGYIDSTITAIPQYKYYLKTNNIISNSLRIQSVDSKPIFVNNIPYIGKLELIPDHSGLYTVVNILPIDEYLKGVVPHEIGGNVHMEALKTQSVLARTYYYSNKNRFAYDYYDLCATQHCQVYKGLTYTNDKVNQAIQATRGEILINSDNIVDKIFYSSSDGGCTATTSDNWGKSSKNLFPNLIGIKTCSNLPAEYNLSQEKYAYKFLTASKAQLNKWQCYDNCSLNRNFRWTREFSADKLHKALTKYNKRYKTSKSNICTDIQSMQVTKRSQTGRVYEVLLKCNSGNTSKIPKSHIRTAFNGLPSNFFIIQKNNNTFKFTGGGFGHGIGLSQFGARNLADQGRDYKEILNIYFPKYQLINIDK